MAAGLPKAHASGAADALLLSCMDFRLMDDIERYMTGRGLRNKYDHVVLAGASLGSVTDKYPAWNTTFWEHLEIAIRLHGIQTVILMDHRDCGAYRVILGAGHATDPTVERATHAAQLKTLKDRINARYPKLTVETLLMGLDGSVEPIAFQDKPKDGWATLLGGGHIALIRHGNAPPGYGGDPPGFKIDDCTTQRNLDDRGREEARALGEAFRQRGVRVDRVVSSPWCRCLDTARLMAVGPVESSWAAAANDEPRTATRLKELKELIAGWRGPGTLVVVTHAVTIRAVAGFLPQQAEIVVVKPGADGASAELVTRIAPPAPR